MGYVDIWKLTKKVGEAKKKFPQFLFFGKIGKVFGVYCSVTLKHN